mmetsp:Transcript_29708/g.65599  ORF Transcript_29708/g.65599 Transcript_29708/m.65599 type:complete len:241 (-) Transcript_29708:59-781(-)
MAASNRELFNCVQSCVQFCSNDADGCEHCEPAIVQFPQTHLFSVLVQADWITEVSGLLVWALGPSTQLEQSCHNEENSDAVGPRGCCHGAQSLGHTLEARKLHIVLDNCSNSCHHSNAAMLDLCGAQVPEASLITHLHKPCRVPEAKWCHCTQLLGGIKAWRALHFTLLLDRLACSGTSTHCARALHCSCPCRCLGSCCACCRLRSRRTCGCCFSSCGSSRCLSCSCCTCCCCHWLCPQW